MYKCSGIIHIHKCALACNACLRFCFFFNRILSSSDMCVSAVVSMNRFWAIVSVCCKTLVETVAPSLLFFPSLRDCAIFSIKSHNLPSGTMAPVFGLRWGVQSGANLARGRIFVFRLLAVIIIPSSSKRAHAFLSVSLLTASKYDRSPWWYNVLPSWSKVRPVWPEVQLRTYQLWTALTFGWV